jgi:hypothetical protein
MRFRSIGFLVASAAAVVPRIAFAEEEEVPQDFPRLVLDTGRPVVAPAEEDLTRFVIHGEYQARYEGLRSFPLDVSAHTVQDHPGAIEDSLGQNDFVYHWLRLTPRFQYKKTIEIVGQLDLLTGVVLGQLAHDTFADQTPRDSYDGFSNVQPRWLYAQINTEIGVLRVGQQPSHWGMGIIANDGDHQPLFGDYRYGSISERVLFATKPGGRDSAVTTVIAGDLVYRDANARITRGDRAFQGVAALLCERGPNQIGLYGVYRHQTHHRNAGDPGSSLFPYTDTIDAAIADVEGKFVAPIHLSDAFVFGQTEAAAIFGSTNAERTAVQALSGNKTQIRSYGGAVQLGVVHKRSCGCATRSGDTPDTPGSANPSDATFGDLVVQAELGYASGDADPNDGVEHRFVFDPNHKVGLLLFDEVMRWQTARASSAAQDPLLQNGARPTPGVDLLPSNGGIYGAQYVNPTFILRPRRWLDLKGGVVIAQATADVVDPYRLAVQGSYVNYRGGDPKRHDLGVEFDGGIEARAPLDFGMVLTLGGQAGVLSPGGALADASGGRMKAPWIAVGRVGLLF